MRLWPGHELRKILAQTSSSKNRPEVISVSRYSITNQSLSHQWKPSHWLAITAPLNFVAEFLCVELLTILAVLKTQWKQPQSLGGSTNEICCHELTAQHWFPNSAPLIVCA
jgi:hypothetical protein